MKACWNLLHLKHAAFSRGEGGGTEKKKEKLCASSETRKTADMVGRACLHRAEKLLPIATIMTNLWSNLWRIQLAMLTVTMPLMSQGEGLDECSPGRELKANANLGQNMVMKSCWNCRFPLRKSIRAASIKQIKALFIGIAILIKTWKIIIVYSESWRKHAD